MRPWDAIISEEEQRAYHAAGFGCPSGLGARPALLIIDVQYRTVGTTPLPFWESIKEFPTSCGDVGWDAVRRIEPLLAQFRHNGWPVLYPHVAPKKGTDGGRLHAVNLSDMASKYADIAPVADVMSRLNTIAEART